MQVEHDPALGSDAHALIKKQPDDAFAAGTNAVVIGAGTQQANADVDAAIQNAAPETGQQQDSLGIPGAAPEEGEKTSEKQSEPDA